MNGLPIFVWISTVLFTLMTFLPFVPNLAGFQYHWGIRGAAAILMILGWWLIFTHFIH